MAKRNDWLGDEMLDRMMNVIMGLAEELYVTRDRLQVMERVLENRGALDREELDRWRPDEDQQREIHRERDAFIQAILARALDKPPDERPGAKASRLPGGRDRREGHALAPGQSGAGN